MLELVDKTVSKTVGLISVRVQFSVSAPYAEVLKRLKRLPWKGSRRLITLQEFESLLLRHLCGDTEEVITGRTANAIGA